MAALTIRNLPDAVVERLKKTARTNGRSMEQEVRELLEERYAARNEITARIRKRWKTFPVTASDEVESWRETGRDRMTVT